MKRLVYISGVLISVALALFAVAGLASGYVHPLECGWLSFFGLILMPVLGGNVLVAIIWMLCRSRWAFLPVVAFLLNIGYFTSMFQLMLPGKEVVAGTRLKVASYNVNNFFTNGEYTLLSVAEYLRKENVDIICLQEYPKPGFYVEDSILKAFSYMPYSCLSERGNGRLSLALFSRYPIEGCKTIPFSQSGNLSLQADLNVDGRTVRVFNNHFQTTSVNVHKAEVKESIREGEGRRHAAFGLAWSMRENYLLRADQVDSVRCLIDESPYPVIVCGDFNDTPASYAYHRIKGDLTDGFKDCGKGYGYTFRELRKLFRIDYIFYSPDFKGVKYKSPDRAWSDHKPVIWEGVLKK